MVQSSFLLASLTILSLAVALPHAEPTLNTRDWDDQAKALYFMTNAPNNEVAAIKVNRDGTLTDGTLTSTGGVGEPGLSAPGKPAGPDALFSQSAVAVAEHFLLAVNPGSNTLSLFQIHHADATHLTLIGKPVDTLGEFPVSVTASAKLNMACVANTGAKAGVSCFSISGTKGLTPLDTVQRPVNVTQTTPPVGPLNSITQVLFDAQSENLITIVKGDTKTIPSFMEIFPIKDGVVSTKGVTSYPAGSAALFGGSLIPGSSDLFVSDAGFGALTLKVSSSDITTTSAKTVIPDQKATCWSTVSDFTKSGYVTDVAANRIVEVDTTTGAIVKIYPLTGSNPGFIDLVAPAKWLYALSPGNDTVPAAIAVLDISAGRGAAKEVQNFQPKGVPAKTGEGLAYIS